MSPLRSLRALGCSRRVLHQCASLKIQYAYYTLTPMTVKPGAAGADLPHELGQRPTWIRALAAAQVGCTQCHLAVLFSGAGDVFLNRLELGGSVRPLFQPRLCLEE